MIDRIGIVTNLEKPGVEEAVRAFVDSARAAQVDVLLETEVSEGLALEVEAVGAEELAGRVDVLASFGGDGTFLRAARLTQDTDVPVLGINLGSLGFLTEIRVEELDEVMQALQQGDYLLEKRRRVRVELWRDGEMVFTTSALNDIVLNMGTIPRAMDIEVEIEGVCIGRYLADGMIVATPTGSTAYNLSAGGPIVDPMTDAVLLTPICPHTLGVRPLILDPDRSIQLRLHDCESGHLTGDGQVSDEVHGGDRIRIPQSEEFSYFLRMPRRNLFQIIQEKLHWGGIARNGRAPAGKTPQRR